MAERGDVPAARIRAQHAVGHGHLAHYAPIIVEHVLTAEIGEARTNFLVRISRRRRASVTAPVVRLIEKRILEIERAARARRQERAGANVENGAAASTGKDVCRNGDCKSDASQCKRLEKRGNTHERNPFNDWLNRQRPVASRTANSLTIFVPSAKTSVTWILFPGVTAAVGSMHIK